MERFLDVLRKFYNKPRGKAEENPDQLAPKRIEDCTVRLQKKGVNIDSLNHALEQSGVVTGDIDVADYAKAFWLESGTTMSEVRISPDFSAQETLEEICYGITGERISLGTEKHINFDVAVRKSKFNFVISVDPETDPKRSDIEAFILWTRSHVQNGQSKVLLYSESRNAIPVDLAKQLIAIKAP